MDGHSSVSGGTSESDCEEPESLADVGGVSSATGHGPPVAPGAPARRRPLSLLAEPPQLRGHCHPWTGRGGFRKEAPRWGPVQWHIPEAQPQSLGSRFPELVSGAAGHGGCSGRAVCQAGGSSGSLEARPHGSQAGQASASAGAGPGGLGLVSVGY